MARFKLWKRLDEWASASMWGSPASESILQHARALMRAEEGKGLQSLAASKIDDIRHLDVAGMEAAVAICTCGRSGSYLLASYLDGHDDVIMLPTSRGHRIYQFFERYPSLSLHDKLISYPVFSTTIFSTDFFQGDFPIAAADYYAAVKALFDVYGNRSPEFLESRRTFFLFLHVAYCAALGRRPAGPRPLIVYAQHYWDDQLARRFVEDFPQARFIHTVRDPITNCGRLFDAWLPWGGFMNAAIVIRHLTRSDQPHPGMESRTCAIRFEDMHLRLGKTMDAVADWLGLPYRSSLLDSTFNGVPWVVERGAISWSGTRPEQAIRDARNLSFTDRGLLFAVLNEDFVAWDYPCPNVFKSKLARVLACMLVLLIPMKIEIIACYRLFKEIPSAWRGGFRDAIKGLTRFFIWRVAIMSLVAAEIFRRLTIRKKLLEMLLRSS